MQSRKNWLTKYYPFITCMFKYKVVVLVMMQRKQFVLREKKEVRKASMSTLRHAESRRRNDSQSIREILDRRHEVSVILS